MHSCTLLNCITNSRHAPRGCLLYRRAPEIIFEHHVFPDRNHNPRFEVKIVLISIHWDRDKFATMILTFSDSLSRISIDIFLLRFHRNVFLMVHLTKYNKHPWIYIMRETQLRRPPNVMKAMVGLLTDICIRTDELDNVSESAIGPFLKIPNTL